jgi:hypothetical protein
MLPPFLTNAKWNLSHPPPATAYHLQCAARRPGPGQERWIKKRSAAQAERLSSNLHPLPDMPTTGLPRYALQTAAAGGHPDNSTL